MITSPPDVMPGEARPRPVMKAAGAIGSILALIGAVLQTAVTSGYVDYDVMTPVAGVIGFLLPLGAALGVWGFSEGKVTPLSDPANETGRRLVDAGSLVDVVRATAPVIADELREHGVKGSQSVAPASNEARLYPTPVADGSASQGRHTL